MVRSLGGFLLSYYLAAYWLVPLLWGHYEHHQKLETAPKTAFTKEGIPGDALNVAMIGSEADLIHSMTAAGWYPADPITFKTSAKITASALFGRAYPTAPVSNLYVFGRIEDLAFEQPVPRTTRQRHHVRFWRSDKLGQDGRPLWIGAATFDRSVGVSHTTGQVTHHIAPDIDEERDKLIGDLLAKQQVVSEYQVTGVGIAHVGKNGGGDQYFTDGEMSVGVLTAGGAANPVAVNLPPNPLAIQAKNGLWTALRAFLKTRL
jgi:hypothetical protein